jgi:hypothetical protein
LGHGAINHSALPPRPPVSGGKFATSTREQKETNEVKSTLLVKTPQNNPESYKFNRQPRITITDELALKMAKQHPNASNEDHHRNKQMKGFKFSETAGSSP